MSEPNPRFSGVSRVYGQPQLQRLQQHHVAVVGLGGVGSWAVEALARTGIGALTLIDLDDICLTNINRQLPALTSTVGQLKTEVLAARVKDINPDCEVRIIDDFLTADNLEACLGEPVTAVLDAIDSVNTKAALIAWCKRRKLPLVTCGGAGGQLDPGSVTMADLAKAEQDPLLAKVRSQLRRDYNFTKNPKRKFGVQAIYSTEQLRYPTGDGGISMAKPGAGSMRMDCSTGFGASMMVTTTFAMHAVAALLKKITA
ncbi:tRNA A37 threonylcarbamoyladenosine dehydratase [Pseudidiomarina planktonica]|uniref:tRNA threonylcarbamoyladenosine dehydratase n=1 Tax=Pseudidiomarina planktonica TaxID=1323738 RepID=A0A1Y6EMB3_9GAMM|nr:tRNA cyclic N6-threonylcarbamoyladenosine(37) synthase TcdA [Pseudidiomarina planktonica]RUO65987.1 tRNA cyclic N6-threonylcarbamoyladenosine(37) synthase TcdA [Pseudidiomarina planktonica]SMQ61303.1 tRNA A37 threonylcarbamoyladenosine dehydratase [Pseudidiomarina planktonica]